MAARFDDFPLRCLLVLTLAAAPGAATGSTADRDEASTRLPTGLTDDPLLNSRFLLFGSDNRRERTLRWAVRTGQRGMVPAMIHALRFLEPEDRGAVVRALRRLTGARIDDDWARWVAWQQQHPEFAPFDGFDVFLTGLFGSLDAGFRDFLHPGMEHRIRLEEIVWGGVEARDGIPALTNPTLLPGAEADRWLDDEDWVFGVEIDGDVRAYPYRVMDWHELLNDTVGGIPVALAYCTLCGSGILFDARRPGGDSGFLFGSSGLLYRSNKLMFDHATNSLWNQFTGEPVVGALAHSGVRLHTLPLVTTRWDEWYAAHPDTLVLGPDTGYERDYSPGKPYGRYFSSRELMFPVATNDARLAQKEVLFGLRITGAERAWPLSAFRGGAVLNERLGALSVVLIGDEATRTVRAYRSGGRSFAATRASTIVSDGIEQWQVREAALVGANGQTLARLPGHLAYWFAWHNYHGSDSLALEDTD